MELRKCGSYIRAILKVKRGVTKIDYTTQDDEDAGEDVDAGPEVLTIVSISQRRLITLLVVAGLRIILALWILVCGSIWLASTRNIQDLVLNSVGLTFILDIDEVVYHTVLTFETRTLFEEIEPLPLPKTFDFTFGGWWAVWNTLVGIACTLVILWALVYNEYFEMKKIRSIMCSGNRDFVVGLNFQANQLFSASSTPWVSGSSTEIPYRQRAVKELINLEDRSDAILSAYVPDFHIFEQLTVHTTFERAGFLRFCIDNPTFSHFREQIRAVTGVSTGISCVDFQRNCTNQAMRELRILCPETCGCANPRSGLLYEGPAEGCPRAICRSSQKYMSALATLECRDLTPFELRLMPAWRSFFNQWIEWGSTLLPGQDASWGPVGQAFIDHGCLALTGFITTTDALGLNNTFSLMTFCEDTDSQSSIRPFCPVTCKCHERFASNCPNSCR
jgi:hypothetical protein